MEEAVLFEIPIYCMSEKEFSKRWSKKKNKMFNMFLESGHSEESAKRGVSTFCFPQCLWKYNQIIGFVIISVTSQNIIFNVCCCMDEVYYADSKRRRYIQDWSLNGTHFYAYEKSEKYIKNQILEWLKAIETEHLPSRFYVDYSAFNNVFPHLNIKQIMRSL